VVDEDGAPVDAAAGPARRSRPSRTTGQRLAPVVAARAVPSGSAGRAGMPGGATSVAKPELGGAHDEDRA